VTPPETTLRVRVLFFARIRDLASRDEITVSLRPGTTVGAALAHLEGTVPALRGQLDACRVAIDKEFVTVDTCLDRDAELAIIPPVSGG